VSEQALARPSGRLRNAASITLLGTGIGALVGFAEGTVIFAQGRLGAVTFASRHVVWMTSLSYALVFTTAGLLIGIGAIAAPRFVDRRLAMCAYVSAAVFSLLLPFGWLSRYAIVLLALGIGTRVWFTWSRHGRAWARYAARLSGVAVLAVMLSGAAPPIAALLEGDTAVDPPPDAISVVLLIWDTARARNLGVYGYDRPTSPSLERIARSGTVFENAISTSPWTLPSHSSMFTGRLPHEVSADWFVALDTEHATLAESFRDAGWSTGGFVANHHYTSDDSGLRRGFQHYEDYLLNLRQAVLTSNLAQTGTGSGILTGLRDRSLSKIIGSIRKFDFYPIEKRTSSRKHADEVNAQFLTWLDRLDGRPFFAFLNYFDAHQLYWAPDSVRARFRGRETPIDAYDAALAYLDQQTGLLFDALAERGRLDNTLFIVTSDHGELFGEHDLSGHASNLYRDVLHVPLIMRLPGVVPAGERVGRVVSLADLPATLTAIAGPGITAFDGSSMTDAFRTDTDRTNGWALAEVRPGRSHPDKVPLSRGPMTALAGGGYHYILNGDGQEELFEWGDIAEERDLAHAPDSAAVRLLGKIRARLRSSLGEPAKFDGWATRDSLIRSR
jgi:arylsulfatase A-like enzyme